MTDRPSSKIRENSQGRTNFTIIFRSIQSSADVLKATAHFQAMALFDNNVLCKGNCNASCMCSYVRVFVCLHMLHHFQTIITTTTTATSGREHWEHNVFVLQVLVGDWTGALDGSTRSTRSTKRLCCKCS